MSYLHLHNTISILKRHPNSLVAFALLTEFLILSTFGCIALLTLEAILPTFISAHIPLPLLFGLLLILFMLHHQLGIWLSIKIRTPNRYILWALLTFLCLWSLCILLLSLLKFPILFTGIIFLALFALLYFARIS